MTLKLSCISEPMFAISEEHRPEVDHVNLNPTRAAADLLSTRITAEAI